MDQNRFLFFRRTLCAVCAFALVLSLTAPAAHAANETVPAGTELTQAQAAAMAEADAAVSELLDSSGYAAMTVDERQAAAEAQLEQLAGEGLVQPGSIRYDEENGMVSFSYDCGVLGGILLTDWEDEPFVDLPLTMPEGLPGPLDAENDVMPLGNAIIYYAFDDTVNSTRYPNYLTMQEAWNGWGLATTIDTDVTVADLRHMDDYDLCVLSTHGAYYTYTTGWLFKQVRTAPVLLLREESSFWDDLRYGFDLLTHRVIKVNGDYCITPDFFAAAYRGGRLEGTMVFSETCEFFGGSNILDLSMSNALLDDPWPKVVRTRAQFASLLGINAPEEAYFEMLADTTKAPDRLLPHTGVSYEWEKLLSSVRIESDDYGTRASTLVELYNEEPPVLHERVIR